LDEDDTWLCFQFDLAVMKLGQHVELLVRDMPEDGSLIIDDLFESKEGKKKADLRYRSAAPFVRRKMEVPASGIW